MAIKIIDNTQEYCQNCPEFECDVECERIYKIRDEVSHDIYVRCEHRRKCRLIRQHLENTMHDDGK